MDVVQAMLKLTDLWLTTIADGLKEGITTLGYDQARLHEISPPCRQYERMHHNPDKAKAGSTADHITPQMLMKWQSRPGVPYLHWSTTTYVHAVWHERCFNIAKVGELCYALPEELEALQCRNDAEAIRLGLGQGPVVCEEEEEEDSDDGHEADADDMEGDHDDNAEAKPEVDRVKNVQVNERMMRQYKEAACRWLTPSTTPTIPVAMVGSHEMPFFCCRQCIICTDDAVYRRSTAVRDLTSTEIAT